LQFIITLFALILTLSLKNDRVLNSYGLEPV
jgi:hypothetical protein